MAIVQVSRITARKGLETDLPQPLAGAELGWAIDQRKLYIGNGELAEGAPTVGNTEILTEYSNILELQNTYTYKGEAAGYVVQTGPTGGDPVVQGLQARLDSFAIITDFGGTGNGVTDDTAAINRALFQLYCRDNNPAIRRGLFFPAGVYKVSDQILIPPYAFLYGEGNNSSVISFEALIWTSTVSYQTGVLVKDGANYYRSVDTVPVGIDISNTSYWDPTTLPTCVASTTDNLQQTGASIGTNGAVRPQSIDLNHMGFATTEIQDGLLLDQCEHISIDAVGITGPLTTTDLTTAIDDTCAIAYNSTVSFVVNNVNINQGKFSGFTYGTNTEQQIESIVYSECVFDTLNRALQIGGVSPVNGGPAGVRIVDSVFDNVYSQGIYVENVNNNLTAHNTFYDVGNHFNGASSPATSIIYFNGWNNISVGDRFERDNLYATTYPRIETNNTNTVALSANSRGIQYYQNNNTIFGASNSFELGTFGCDAGIQDTLANNTTATLAVVTKAVMSSFIINYAIIRGDLVKTGEILVVGGQGTTTTGFTTDETRYVQNGSTGVTFNLSDSGTEITFGYTTTNTVAGIIRYTISSFGA